MNKKIIICGSGTAGLITAITLKHSLPSHEVTVVSSSKIGIIGVGEGSTEHWRQFCDSVGMNKGEMVDACKATHKYGIYYENWTNHTPYYFHSVALEPKTVFGYYGNYAYALENNMLLTNVSSQPLINDMVISCPPSEVHNLTNQFHFDTFKLNEYLRSFGTKKGIKFVDGEIVDVVQNLETGWLESLRLDEERTIDGDFFVDATGFHRAIMSRILPDDEFVNYRKYLPCDSSAVFPTPSQEDGSIHPYTRARAMPSGWMFEIPLQHRLGCGYVFNDEYTSVDDAKKEIETHIGQDITIQKVFDFKPQLLPGFLDGDHSLQG